MKQTIIKQKRDHVLQWVALKRLYMAKRGSDPSRFGKAIPRTTNADVRQLVRYWHGEYLRQILRHPKALDRDKASRKRWVEAKRTIDSQLAKASPNALYSSNEWFWDSATSRLAIYLESRKAIPSRARLAFESVRETVDEHIESAKNLARDVAGGEFWPWVKTGALVAGGLVAAAIVIPPIVRAFKD